MLKNKIILKEVYYLCINSKNYSVLYITQVMIGHQSNYHSIISDFCDGSHYRSHPLFSSDHPAVEIVLYYDELELCNPLGSKRTKYKIG